MSATTIVASTSNQEPTNSFIPAPNSASTLFAGWGPRL